MATSAIGNRELWVPRVSAPWTDHAFGDTQPWTLSGFAREQVRGLVRQVFFANAAQPVRQVVFTAADSQTDIGIICQQVGEGLASETQGGIAVVGCGAETLEASEKEQTFGARRPVESVGPRSSAASKSNLWFVSHTGIAGARRSTARAFDSHRDYARLAELRREFEYSIVASPPAGESSDAAAMGLLADGVVLVLAANRTRRATARKIMDSLRAAHVQMLGVVLSDRTFPIPQNIYRHL